MTGSIPTPEAIYHAAVVAAFPFLALPREALSPSGASGEPSVLLYPVGLSPKLAAELIARSLSAAQPLIERRMRAQLAADLERVAAEQYPESVFTPGSRQPDGIAGGAMRHAYRAAARRIRECRDEREGR